MGLGTGVLRAYHLYYFFRGLTVGVVGASSLYIANRSGVPQHWLFAARGVGLIFGPLLFSPLVGRVVWCGESQYGFALALFAKATCELILPRAASGAVLLPAFFVLGLCMTLLDTHGCMLVTRIFGEKCSLPLNIYNALYGLGAAIAPFFVITAPSQAFNLLAGVDLLMASALTLKRLRWGKPRQWKIKIRRPGSPSPGPASPPDPEAACQGSAPIKQRGLPPRVLCTGLAFILFGSACETAISSWGFTFAAKNLGLPAKIAATFPAAFYFTYTAMRLVVIPVSMKLLPSTIIQAGTLLTLLGAMLLRTCAGNFHANPNVGLLIFCVVLIGAGTSPFFAMTLASLRQHAELNPMEQGFYSTCTALGNCLGLWLPGLVDLPQAEVVWAVAIFLILNANMRDFPWSQRWSFDTEGSVKPGTKV